MDDIAEAWHACQRELELIIAVNERTERRGSGVVNRQDCGRARGRASGITGHDCIVSGVAQLDVVLGVARCRSASDIRVVKLPLIRRRGRADCSGSKAEVVASDDRLALRLRREVGDGRLNPIERDAAHRGIETVHRDAISRPVNRVERNLAADSATRIIVAHDLNTGLAMRPQWGPMNGDNAVSEQGLLEQAIDRLPAGSIVLGDANFGVFSVAYAATQRGHPVVLRLTTARARALAKEDLRDGMDRRIRWQPSPHERRHHPGLPADAGVEGRLIVRQVQPSNGHAPFLLALFTTLKDDADSVIELYGHRWNIETDLRSLKSTLRLELSSTTPEMVAKDIHIGMLAYNLIRAVTCVAAQKADLKPRQFSFTRVCNVINAFAPMIAAAKDERQAQQLFDDMMYYVHQAKLPRRRKKRPTYPRAVWHKPQTYPKRKE